MYPCLTVARRAVWLSFAAGVVACGGGDELPAVPSEAYRRAIAAFCEPALACSNRPAGYTFADQASCERVMLNSMGGSGAMEKLDAAAGRGTITWSIDDAEYCLALANAWFASATCQQLWATKVTLNFDDPRCEQLGLGTVALGGSCTGSHECADDASCRSGTCQP